MLGIVFDMDGVLVDSMPSHYIAWKRAFKEIAEIDVSKRDIYIREGMTGPDLVRSIFDYNNYSKDNAKNVIELKNRIFRENRRSPAFRGVSELLEGLDCSKAVVSGSSRKDVEEILHEAFGEKLFDVVVTGDDVNKGKPNPDSFLSALNKMNLKPSQSLVVENAPLGVKAANHAEIRCIVVLNNTPLLIEDFDLLIDRDSIYDSTDKIKPIIYRCKK